MTFAKTPRPSQLIAVSPCGAFLVACTVQQIFACGFQIHKTNVHVSTCQLYILYVQCRYSKVCRSARAPHQAGIHSGMHPGTVTVSTWRLESVQDLSWILMCIVAWFRRQCSSTVIGYWCSCRSQLWGFLVECLWAYDPTQLSTPVACALSAGMAVRCVSGCETLLAAASLLMASTALSMTNWIGDSSNRAGLFVDGCHVHWKLLFSGSHKCRFEQSVSASMTVLLKSQFLLSWYFLLYHYVA